METEVIREFEFDFELPLKNKFEAIWEEFPCCWPLKLCRWHEENDGTLNSYIGDSDEED